MQFSLRGLRRSDEQLKFPQLGGGSRTRAPVGPTLHIKDARARSENSHNAKAIVEGSSQCRSRRDVGAGRGNVSAVIDEGHEAAESVGVRDAIGVLPEGRAGGKQNLHARDRRDRRAGACSSGQGRQRVARAGGGRQH